MRQIFLLILFFIVGQWLVKALRRADGGASTRSAGGAGAASGNGAANGAGNGMGERGMGNGAASRGARAPKQLAEPMIRCAECGVHAPKSDSVVVAGQPFCSADHAHRHAVRTGTNRRDAR